MGVLFVLLTNTSHMLLGWGCFIHPGRQYRCQGLARHKEGGSLPTHQLSQKEFGLNISKQTNMKLIFSLVKRRIIFIVYNYANKCKLKQHKRKPSINCQPKRSGNKATSHAVHISISLPHFHSFPSVSMINHPLIPSPVVGYRSPHMWDHQLLWGSTLFSQSLSKIEFLWEAFHTLEQFPAALCSAFLYFIYLAIHLSLFICLSFCLPVHLFSHHHMYVYHLVLLALQNYSFMH